MYKSLVKLGTENFPHIKCTIPYRVMVAPLKKKSYKKYDFAFKFKFM